MQENIFDEPTTKRAVRLCHQAVELCGADCAEKVGTVWVSRYRDNMLAIATVIAARIVNDAPAFACIRIKHRGVVVLDAELGDPGELMVFAPGDWERHLRNTVRREALNV